MASRPKDIQRTWREWDGLVDRLATGVALLAVIALIALTPLA